MVRLIAFLGNKGTQYSATRHNCGWMACDAWCRTFPSQLQWSEKFHGRWATLSATHGKVVLLKPLTFMNESGRSIGEACRWFGISASETLVVHDDVELPFGTVKLQAGGGLGGHNGLRSTATHLAGNDFIRLRVGIGRPHTKDMASFVLSRFAPDEEASLPRVLGLAIDMIQTCLGTDRVQLPLLLTIDNSG